MRQKRLTRLAAASACTVCAVVVMTGCGSDNETSSSGEPTGEELGEPVEGGTFTQALPFDPGASFDPYRNLKVSPIARYAYDSLVKVDSTGEVVPNLAEKWSADGSSATFTLRSGITCSDGTELKASDVAAALNHVLDPATESAVFGVLTPSVPYAATAKDAKRTVHVEMEQPFSFTVEQLGQLPIVCPKGLENPDLLADTSAGTGPYVLEEIVAGDRLVFSARDGYAWGPDGKNGAPGTPAEVVLRIVPNPTTAANLLLSGEVNAVRLSGSDLDRVQGQDLFKREYDAQFGLLTFNQLDGRATGDQDLRTALLQALDLEQLAQVGTGGKGSRATSLLTGAPPLCEYDSVADALPDHDAEAAKAALEQAGWTAGANGTLEKDGEPLQVALHYQTDILGPASAAAELIAQQWKEIGVAATLVPEDTNAALNTLYVTHDWDVYWGEQTIYYPSDLSTYFSGSTPPDGNNYPGIRNEEFEQSAAAAQDVAGAQSCPAWQEAETALVERADIVPVATSPTVEFGRDAQFELGGSNLITIEPTSIRLYK